MSERALKEIPNGGRLSVSRFGRESDLVQKLFGIRMVKSRYRSELGQIVTRSVRVDGHIRVWGCLTRRCDVFDSVHGINIINIVNLYFHDTSERLRKNFKLDPRRRPGIYRKLIKGPTWSSSSAFGSQHHNHHYPGRGTWSITSLFAHTHHTTHGRHASPSISSRSSPSSRSPA